MIQGLFNQANHNPFMECFDADALEVMNSTLEEYKKRPIYGRVTRLADRLFGELDYYDTRTPATNLLARSAFIGGAAVARQLVLSSKLPLYRKYRVLGSAANEPIDALLHPSSSVTSLYDTIRTISDNTLREEFTVSVVARKVGTFYGETAESPTRIGVREAEYTAATMGVGYLAHVYSNIHNNSANFNRQS